MTKIGSKAICFDNTGVIKVKIFKKLGSGNVQKATYGDIVYVCVLALNRKAKNLEEEKQKKRFRIGSLHKAAIIQMAEPFRRKDNTRIWFIKDGVVLTDKRGMPLGRKIKTVVPKEIAYYFPQIASISMRVC